MFWNGRGQTPVSHSQGQPSANKMAYSHASSIIKNRRHYPQMPCNMWWKIQSLVETNDFQAVKDCHRRTCSQSPQLPSQPQPNNQSTQRFICMCKEPPPPQPDSSRVSHNHSTSAVNLGNKPEYTGYAASIFNDSCIMNLFSYRLSDFECSILCKGLSFSPSPCDFDLRLAIEATENLHHSLCPAHFYLMMPHPVQVVTKVSLTKISPPPPPSNWTASEPCPPALQSFVTTNYSAFIYWQSEKSHETISTFLPLINLPRLPNKFVNFNNQEREAAKSLLASTKIIIRALG